MEVFRTLRPGARGTKRYANRYGTRLVCVLYRYDARRRKRYATVEIIVDEAALVRPKYQYTDAPRPNCQVLVRIAYRETALRERLKEVGVRRQPQGKLWRLPYRKVVQPGIEGRVVGSAMQAQI